LSGIRRAKERVTIDIGDLEHFQAKWEPVRRPEMRQLKEIERFRDSTQTESALARGIS
jgi:hypothetical protein